MGSAGLTLDSAIRRWALARLVEIGDESGWGVDGRMTSFLDERLVAPSREILRRVGTGDESVESLPPAVPEEIGRYVDLDGLSNPGQDAPVVMLKHTETPGVAASEEDLRNELPPQVWIGVLRYIADQWQPWAINRREKYRWFDERLAALQVPAALLRGDDRVFGVIQDAVYRAATDWADALSRLERRVSEIGALERMIGGRMVVGVDSANTAQILRDARVYHSALVLGRPVPSDPGIERLRSSVSVDGRPCDSVRPLRELMEWLKAGALTQEIESDWCGGLSSGPSRQERIRYVDAACRLIRSAEMLRRDLNLDKP